MAWDTIMLKKRRTELIILLHDLGQKRFSARSWKKEEQITYAFKKMNKFMWTLWMLYYLKSIFKDLIIPPKVNQVII